MKRFSTLFLRLSAAATTAILVAACGGGGGGSTTPVTDPVQTPVQQPVTPPAGGNAGAGTPATPQLLAQYQGTWNLGCVVENTGTGTTLVAVGSSRDRLVINAPAANGSALGFSSQNFYTSLDCTGAPVAIVTDPAGTISPAGTKTIGAVTAVKVDITAAAGAVTISGSAARLGACIPNGSQQNVIITLGTGMTAKTICVEGVIAAINDKTVLSVVSATNTFDVGDDGATDAQGYPNQFASVADQGRYTKQ